MSVKKSKTAAEIEKAVGKIRTKVKDRPEVAIILGTGLGALANEIEGAKAMPYSEIPGFPLSSVEFHAGRLVFG